MSLSAPELSQAACALAASSCSSISSRSRSSFSSPASIFLAALICCWISFFAFACLTRLASSLVHSAPAFFVYAVRLSCASVICPRRSLVAFWPRWTLPAPSRKSWGSSVSISWASGGSPPARYCARAAAPACCLSRSIRTWPLTISLASLTSSADWLSARSSARLYASVAEVALPYSPSIFLRTVWSFESSAAGDLPSAPGGRDRSNGRGATGGSLGETGEAGDWGEAGDAGDAGAAYAWFSNAGDVSTDRAQTTVIATLTQRRRFTSFPSGQLSRRLFCRLSNSPNM